MPINITMPALSPTMEEGNLSKWLVKEGDKVKSGDVLAEIETDKATMEVESVDEGTVAKLVVAAGTEGVKVNALIAILAADGEDVSAAAAGGGASPAPKAEAAPAPKAEAAPAQKASNRRLLSRHRLWRLRVMQGPFLRRSPVASPRKPASTFPPCRVPARTAVSSRPISKRLSLPVVPSLHRPPLHRLLPHRPWPRARRTIPS